MAKWEAQAQGITITRDDWGIAAESEPAESGDWERMTRIWSLCDGQASLTDIVERALFGRFRGLLALDKLIKSGCVVLVDGPERRRPT